MNYDELAKNIYHYVGGNENMIRLEHCATRLRFNLKDDTLAQTKQIEQLEGVVSVINKGGQYQVVIGSDVVEVFQAFQKLGKFETTTVEQQETKSMINRILDTISGIFFPIVPALAGAGMLKALLSLLSVTNIVSPASQSYQMLNFMGDALFYFLPIIVAASAAKKLNVNMYVAMAIGAMLLHPAFISMAAGAKEAGTSMQIFGLPIAPVSYTSSVIPIILAIWFMSYIEPIVDRHMFKPIRLFMTPLLSMLLVGIASFVVLGPLGYYLGAALGTGIDYINQFASWIVPLLVGAFTPLMVMTGMHYGLIPLGINQLAISGIDTIAGPGMLVSNIAQGGASLAVAFKTKNTNLKSLASSAGISAVCGITEPAMYGISLRYKKPLIAAMIGGGLGGLFLGIMQVGRFAQVAPGIFALPSFIGSSGMNNFFYACIGSVIAFCTAFLISYFLGVDEVPSEDKMKKETSIIMKDEVLYAPLQGKSIPLSQVNDPLFSSGTMGKGAAIIPSDGKLYAPIDGTIRMVFETGHAIGMVSEQGSEILIHVGMDTVELKGMHFDPKVTCDMHVKKGDVLLEFDLEAITKLDYDCTTPVIITNANPNSDVQIITQGNIESGNEFFVVSEKKEVK